MRLLPPLDENFKIGVKYQRLGLFDEAILKFSESLKEIIHEPFLFYHIGECNLRKGCYTDAENFFIKVQEYFESTSFDEVELNIKRQRMHNLYPNGVNILLMAQIELSILYSSTPTPVPSAVIIFFISSLRKILSNRAFSTFKIFPLRGKMA